MTDIKIMAFIRNLLICFVFMGWVGLGFLCVYMIFFISAGFWFVYLYVPYDSYGPSDVSDILLNVWGLIIYISGLVFIPILYRESWQRWDSKSWKILGYPIVLIYMSIFIMGLFFIICRVLNHPSFILDLFGALTSGHGEAIAIPSCVLLLLGMLVLITRKSSWKL